jgi:hypothetical protein
MFPSVFLQNSSQGKQVSPRSARTKPWYVIELAKLGGGIRGLIAEI